MQYFATKFTVIFHITFSTKTLYQIFYINILTICNIGVTIKTQVPNYSRKGGIFP